jgi:tetratricopeptide (TPR) repeat protein
MFKLPYELMMKVIDKKDKEFEDKYGSIGNRDRIFKEQLIKGLEAFNKKKYYEAIDFCKQAQETLLTNPMIDMILGGSYYSIGDYDSSLRYLKIANNNGYAEANEYIKLIKKKEKEMTYERPIKFGVKIGYNVNSLKSALIAGLFLQGRTGKWGVKNFSILTELQFFQAQYNQEIEQPYFGKSIYVNNDNILQTNLLFKNSLNKRIALVYGIGMSAGLESQSIMFDINAGFQYHFSQYFFTEFRYNRNLTRSYFQGDGIVVYEPNNFNVSLGYKF